MSTPRERIQRELGQKMLDEIDMLLRRLDEEKQALLLASARIAEIDERVAVLQEERAKLIARGRERIPANESALVALEKRP